MVSLYRNIVSSFCRYCAKAKYRGRQFRRESTCEEAVPSNRIYQGCVGTCTVRGLRIGAGRVSSRVTTHFRTGKTRASIFLF